MIPSKKNFFFISLCVFFTAYPPLINWVSFGLDGIFKYFAADTFYYLTVANNSGWTPLFSFDGELPTNGFHPLYQIYLKIILNVPPLSGDIKNQITFIYLSSIILISLSTFLISVRLIDLGFSKILTVITLVPGFYHIFFSDLSQSGNIWYFNNGMESSFSIFFFSIIFYFISKKNFFNFKENNNKNILFFSILTVLVVLSRLDDIFIIFAFLLHLFFLDINNKHKIKYSLIFFVVTSLFIISYLIINLSYSGSIMPSSASTKFGTSAYYNIMSVFNIFLPAGELMSSNNWIVWEKTSSRALQILAPLLLSLFFIIYYFARGINGQTNFFAKILFYLSIYVILKSLYNLLFVWLWHQGHWYYPINLIIFNLTILYFINEFFLKFKIKVTEFKISITKNSYKYIKILILLNFILLILILSSSIDYTSEKDLFLLGFSKLRFFSYVFYISLSLILFIYLFNLIKRKKTKINFLYPNIILILLLFVYSNSYINFKNLSNSNNNGVFYNNHKKINFDLLNYENQINEKLKIISYDDGIIASLLNFNVLSGLGFSLDKEALTQKKRGRLLDIAFDRGYNHITSLHYIREINVPLGTNINHLLGRTFWLSDYEKENYNFELVYFNKETKFILIKFKKIK